MRSDTSMAARHSGKLRICLLTNVSASSRKSLRPPENPESEITGRLFQRLPSTGKSGCPNFEHFAKTGVKTRSHPVPPTEERARKHTSAGKRFATDEQVRAVMERLKAGECLRAVARELKLSPATISYWVSGKRRRDATGGSLYTQVTGRSES